MHPELGFHFPQALPEILDEDLCLIESGIHSGNEYDQDDEKENGKCSHRKASVREFDRRLGKLTPGQSKQV